MPTFQQFIAAGVDRAFYGVLDDEGDLAGGTLTPPATGSAAGSPMLRLRGVVSADPTVQEPEVVNIPGDNGSQGNFIFAPEQSPSFTLEKSVFDLALQALAQGTLVYADGDVSMGALQPDDPAHPDLCWVLQSPTKKKDIGQNGLKAWSGYFLPLTQAYPLGRAQYQTRAAAVERMRIATTPVGKMFDGMEIDDTTLGTSGAPIIPFTSDYPVYFHRFTGDGTETTFVLDHTPAAESTVRVRVDGTLATPTTDYTVNLTTREIVFQAGHIPALNAKIIVRVGMA